ncbi:acyl-CoA Delta(11) desaturase [Copidosoma floridanum]|uniref:acyl-CoA Delta(11) desaturase n=1 Tax=Copidosoma floridanum TaxID=29053 RepID=UPI0006C94AEC|nr:acyl-CoA Delta(11) desaturase [Copidosoma floridanum]XP_014212115.1 acyl-CoA Delta(11) desaturase [Copidosoma floridanum]
MAPNETMSEKVLSQAKLVDEPGKDICEAVDIKKLSDAEESQRISDEYYASINKPFLQRTDVKWFNLTFMVVLHAVAIYGFLTFPYLEKKRTFAWGWFLAVIANFGVAGGVHRLWSHRAYKAKLPLRVILMLCYLTSGQYSAMTWIKDHRVHHKFSETDADPVNSVRGFWFSHLGWLTLKRHPEVLRKGRQIDFSDCLSDPVIKFEEKYFFILRPVFAFLIPILVPVYFWNETWYWAILSQAFMRYAYSLNCTWSINSFAHMFGGRPYDKAIAPAENILMSLITGGEGWHNYHHIFPWDYKTAELGNYITGINLTLYLIDLFAKIGWAYDRKVPSEELVRNVIKNRGDGTHPIQKSLHSDKKK